MNDIPREVALHLVDEYFIPDLYNRTGIKVIDDSLEWRVVGHRQEREVIFSYKDCSYRLIHSRTGDDYNGYTYGYEAWCARVPVEKVQQVDVIVTQWSVVK